MSEPLLRLESVTCTYGGAPVVAGADLEIHAGDFCGIVGPSGSGKTTLLRAVLGTVRPTAGTVWRAPRLAIGYVPQVETVNWNFPVTVAEAVLMARTTGLPVYVTFTLTRNYNTMVVRGSLPGIGSLVVNAAFAPGSISPHILQFPEPLAKRYDPQSLQPPGSYVAYEAPNCQLTRLGVSGTFSTTIL